MTLIFIAVGVLLIAGAIGLHKLGGGGFDQAAFDLGACVVGGAGLAFIIVPFIGR